MSLKGTKLHSILHAKCPRCQEGDFFLEKNSYNLKKFDKMYEHCPVCGQSFQMETGFYYGAMYVSYGLSVAYGIALFLIMMVLFGLSLEIFFITVTISLLLLIPPVYRLSRLIWINMFVKYSMDSAGHGHHGNKEKPAISKY